MFLYTLYFFKSLAHIPGQAAASRPSILALLSINHVMYDRSPTSSSSSSALLLWHSVKQGPLRHQHLQDLCFGFPHHSPEVTAPLPPSPLHPALTLQLPVTILGGQNCLQVPLSGKFAAGPWLNFSDGWITGHLADSAERSKEWCAISLAYNLTPHAAPSDEFSSLI